MAAKAFHLSLIAFFISGNHQACGWHLTLPKGMKNLAAFNAKKVKRVVAEEREREKCISLQKDSESQSKKQSRPNGLGVSGSVKARKSEKIIQLSTFSPRGQKYLWNSIEDDGN